MTIQEFKAWLDGFSEAIDEAPTPEQWAKIKNRIAELKVIHLTEPHIPSDWKWPMPRIGEPMWTGPGDINWVTTCGNVQ